MRCFESREWWIQYDKSNAFELPRLWLRQWIMCCREGWPQPCWNYNTWNTTTHFQRHDEITVSGCQMLIVISAIWSYTYTHELVECARDLLGHPVWLGSCIERREGRGSFDQCKGAERWKSRDWVWWKEEKVNLGRATLVLIPEFHQFTAICLKRRVAACLVPPADFRCNQILFGRLYTSHLHIHIIQSYPIGCLAVQYICFLSRLAGD